MKHIIFGTAFKKHKKALIAGGLFLSIFAVSAGSAYFVLPQTVIRETEKSENVDIIEDHKMTGRERFISNLANSAANGISINANKMLFEFDGKEEIVVNEDTSETTIAHSNLIDAAGTTIDLALSSISLHGINLAITAPISYSDASARVHKRGLHASMIDSQIYLNLFDQGEDEQGEWINRAWDFKYKVDARAYDVTENESKVIDPVTGGVQQYEYGDLDWLIEDIFSILSEGGIDLSLQGWLDGLTSASSNESAAEPASNSEGGISTDAIMDSMEDMIETTHEGNPYFIWNLPLGNMNLSLGMRSNDEFTFTGIDLPALYDYTQDEDGTAHDFVLKENPAWEIQEGMRLTVQADVTDFEEGHLEGWSHSLIPGDYNDYKDLRNSRFLLESVAKYVAHPKFGLDIDLDLGYSSDGKAGDRTHVKKDPSSDSMRIGVYADADLDGRKFNGVNAKLSLMKMAESEPGELERVAGHDVNVAYLYDHQNKEGNGYLDIDREYFKAHTTKTYLDEFYAEVLNDAFSGSSTEEKAEGQNDMNQIQSVLKTLGLSLDSIMESDFLRDLKNGVYVSALDFIKSFRNDDNLIEIVLTLAPIGLEGEVTLTLKGTENKISDLLAIDISGIKFASFTLNGSIKTRDFQELPTVSSFEGLGYDDLSHLKGIGEQVTDIVHEKAFSADLGVTLGESETPDLSVDGGLNFAFDDDYKQGKVDLRVHQNLTDKIVSDHRLAVDLRDSYKTVALSYGSSDDASSLDTMPEDAIYSKLSLDAFTEAGEDGTNLLGRLLGSVTSLDDRFSRLTASFAKQAAPSLLSRVTGGEVSALLEKSDILKTADVHADNGDTLVVINGDAIGMDSDIAIAIKYQAGSETKEGGIEALHIDMNLGGKDLNVALDNIAPMEKEGRSATDFQNFENVESFHDIGFVSELAEYAVGALTLGTSAAEDENGNKIVSGISYYGLQGDLAVAIGPHTLKLGLFDAYASVEGAETKIYANLEGLPVIRGVNGPDSDIYFRPNEGEGVRNAEIYYYANGIDPKGQALLTRDSSYGRVRNVRDAVRLEGEQFTDGLIGWLGRYSLGIVDQLLDGESSSAAPKGRMVARRAGILGNEALRIETVLHKIQKTTQNGIDTYTISVDLGALLGIPVLGDASVSLMGQTVHNGDSTYKTLTGINIHADGRVKGSSNSLKLASVDVDLYLNNIVNGAMVNVWDLPQNAAYAANFVGQVPDTGILSEVSKGLLYDLHDLSFANPDSKETALYGYNYVGKSSAKPGNHYIGL